MKKITRTLLLLLILSVLRYPLNAANAEVPHLINYQGRLADSTNNPLTGSYAITFRIYDAETAGTLLWEEPQTGIVVQKGIFNVLLGSVTALNLAFDKPYFLEIKVGNEVMNPRQRITSAGYAIKAENADNATKVANVEVSTTPTANKLLPLDANAKLPLSALKIYDSGWFAVSTRNAYTKTHNLGTTKVLLQLYFSENSNGSGKVTLMQNSVYNVLGVQYNLKALSTTQVTIVVGGQVSAESILDWYDENGNRWNPKTGYARIVMLALE